MPAPPNENRTPGQHPRGRLARTMVRPPRTSPRWSRATHRRCGDGEADTPRRRRTRRSVPRRAPPAAVGSTDTGWAREARASTPRARRPGPPMPRNRSTEPQPCLQLEGRGVRDLPGAVPRLCEVHEPERQDREQGTDQEREPGARQKRRRRMRCRESVRRNRSHLLATSYARSRWLESARRRFEPLPAPILSVRGQRSLTVGEHARAGGRFRTDRVALSSTGREA
jgi:hypothetical protein